MPVAFVCRFCLIGGSRCCTAQGHEQNECSESPDGERVCKKKRMWFDGLPNRTVVTVPGFGRPRCPAPPPSASKACGLTVSGTRTRSHSRQRIGT